jgi:hypothetical protein
VAETPHEQLFIPFGPEMRTAAGTTILFRWGGTAFGALFKRF